MPPVLPHQLRTFLAQSAVGYFQVAGNTTVTDFLTIGTRTYEATVAGVGTHDVNIVFGAGPDAPAVAIPKWVAGINADASRTVDALADPGNTGFFLVTRTPGATNPALAASVTVGGAIVRSAATMLGGQAATFQSLVENRYTVTAQDVTTLGTTLGTAEIVLGAFPSTTEPHILGVTVRRANAIVDLADALIRMRQVNANYWVLVYAEPAGGALLANGDVIDYSLAIAGA